MGVHDYICFVQRNDQNISPFSGDQDSSGEGTAIVVYVPITYSKETILSWPLTHFRQFEARILNYSWDKWSFDEVEGYGDVLTGTKPWWNTSIWVSPDVPGYHIVNFQPDAYYAFVQERYEIKQISRAYLKQVYENRQSESPKDKRLAVQKIIEAGQENLWEYHNKQLPPFNIPQDYLKIWEEEIFRKAHLYSVKTPSDLHRARFCVLVCDNLHLRTSLQVLDRWDPNGNSTFRLHFRPEQLSPELVDGCIVCHKKRWPGLYTCLDHCNMNTETRREETQQEINLKAAEIVNQLKRVEGPPRVIPITFQEKGKEYSLELKLE